MYILKLKQFLTIFGKDRFLKLLAFALMSIIAGGIELVGVALIYPFALAMISPSDIFNKLTFLPNNVYLAISAATPQKIDLFVGIFAMLVFILKNIYMFLFTYVQSRFLEHWKLHVSRILMKFFLCAPYKITRKLSETDKLYMLQVVSVNCIDGFVQNCLKLFINVIIILCILSLILYKFYIAGIVSITFIVISVILHNRLFKSRLEKIKSNILNVTKDFNDATYTIINFLKEIKIQNVELKFFDKYNIENNKLTKMISNLNFYNGISPYIIECLIITTLIIITIMVSQNNIQSSNTMAYLALIAAAVFRIAPALNRIQSGLINIHTNYPFVNELLNFYDKYNLSNYEYFYQTGERVEFNHKIEFRNVYFSYEPNKPVLKDISFEINKGEFVGIIGLSGAGKSTLADVLSGLLETDAGEILIDGQTVNITKEAGFRKNIGYVQQEFDVLERSFRENIAWDVLPEEIDDKKVIRVIKQVRLWDIVNRYENGIYSVPFIGESGLSSGQKQRIAIARALYKNPSILIFDEATSALDVKVESEITEILQDVCQNKTIIAIAHRISTLRACKKLIYMKDGEIADVGTFEELSGKYKEFAEIIKLSGLK